MQIECWLHNAQLNRAHIEERPERGAVVSEPLVLDVPKVVRLFVVAHRQDALSAERVKAAQKPLSIDGPQTRVVEPGVTAVDEQMVVCLREQLRVGALLERREHVRHVLRLPVRHLVRAAVQRRLHDPARALHVQRCGGPLRRDGHEGVHEVPERRCRVQRVRLEHAQREPERPVSDGGDLIFVRDACDGEPPDIVCGRCGLVIEVLDVQGTGRKSSACTRAQRVARLTRRG